MKFAPLLLALLSSFIPALASPLFPDFSRDGQSIQGSPLIGQNILTPGRYLFALEDLRVGSLAFTDYDYNDVYGEITVYGEDLSFYSILIQGGLGAYYNNNLVGFSGTRFINNLFTLVFNTPTGEMFSGTQQVLIYKLAEPNPSSPSPTPTPEPSYTSMIAFAVVILFIANPTKRKK